MSLQDLDDLTPPVYDRTPPRPNAAPSGKDAYRTPPSQRMSSSPAAPAAMYGSKGSLPPAKSRGLYPSDRQRMAMGEQPRTAPSPSSRPNTDADRHGSRLAAARGPFASNSRPAGRVLEHSADGQLRGEDAFGRDFDSRLRPYREFYQPPRQDEDQRGIVPNGRGHNGRAAEARQPPLSAVQNLRHAARQSSDVRQHSPRVSRETQAIPLYAARSSEAEDPKQQQQHVEEGPPAKAQAKLAKLPLERTRERQEVIMAHHTVEPAKVTKDPTAPPHPPLKQHWTQKFKDRALKLDRALAQVAPRTETSNVQAGTGKGNRQDLQEAGTSAIAHQRYSSEESGGRSSKARTKGSSQDGSASASRRKQCSVGKQSQKTAESSLRASDKAEGTEQPPVSKPPEEDAIRHRSPVSLQMLPRGLQLALQANPDLRAYKQLSVNKPSPQEPYWDAAIRAAKSNGTHLAEGSGQGMDAGGASKAAASQKKLPAVKGGEEALEDFPLLRPKGPIKSMEWQPEDGGRAAMGKGKAARKQPAPILGMKGEWVPQQPLHQMVACMPWVSPEDKAQDRMIPDGAAWEDQGKCPSTGLKAVAARLADLKQAPQRGESFKEYWTSDCRGHAMPGISADDTSVVLSSDSEGTAELPALSGTPNSGSTPPAASLVPRPESEEQGTLADAEGSGAAAVRQVQADSSKGRAAGVHSSTKQGTKHASFGMLTTLPPEASSPQQLESEPMHVSTALDSGAAAEGGMTEADVSTKTVQHATSANDTGPEAQTDDGAPAQEKDKVPPKRTEAEKGYSSAASAPPVAGEPVHVLDVIPAISLVEVQGLQGKSRLRCIAQLVA